MHSQPVAVVLVVWGGSAEALVEGWAVVVVVQVAEFVEHEVLDAGWRQQDDAPVKVQLAALAAGSPAVAEVPDLDTLGLHGDPVLQRCDPVGEPWLGVIGVPADEVDPALIGAISRQQETAFVQPEFCARCIVDPFQAVRSAQIT